MSIATTIEQSKKLLELGINYNTADMYYAGGVLKRGVALSLSSNIPAWSLGALLILMPEIRFHSWESVYSPYIGKYGKGWKCTYTNGEVDEHCCLGYNPVDVAVEMIEWLVINKYLKV